MKKKKKNVRQNAEQERNISNNRMHDNKLHKGNSFMPYIVEGVNKNVA